MGKRKASRKNPLEERDRLVGSLPELGEILRGSLVSRFRRCGKAGCHCAEEGDPGHGPAYYLVVTVSPGQTVQVYVPKDQKQQVEEWISNFRSVREVLEQISTLNRELLREGLWFRGG
jgi:hypothetical protein